MRYIEMKPHSSVIFLFSNHKPNSKVPVVTDFNVIFLF